MTDAQAVQAPELHSAPATLSQDAPETKFVDYPFDDSILQDIQAAGFVQPTPIQAATIPAALEGKDIIGLAQTGTGKTAAFALPIIQKLAQCTELAALVITPTRELAMQVTGVFNHLGKSSGMRIATIVGGIPMDNDYKALRSWPNVLVATPGRLIDHITYGSISLKDIQVLVVDEADRMHDMGFIPQIRRILDELPENRQTLMFTATMPKDVERIARMSMKDPVRIQMGMQVPVEGATQQLFRVTDEEKGSLLMKLLGESNTARILVFVRTKRGCDKLHRIVSRRFHAARIHGDREQYDRDEAMNGFRQGRYRILIATDIAARGIDVADIEHVINYDFPLSAEDYVHRIGRTARQQAKGLATSFVTSNDQRFLIDAYKLLGDKLPLTDDLKDLLGGRSRHRSSGRNGSESRGNNHRSSSHDRQPSRPAPAPQPQIAAAQPVQAVAIEPETATAQEGKPSRNRRSRGRGRRSPQSATAASAQAQPQDGSEAADKPVRGESALGNNGTKVSKQPVVASPAPVKRAPSAAPDEPRKPVRRRKVEPDNDDDGGVVILDRCDDGPDGIVGEEGRRGNRYRSPRRQPRSGGGRRQPKAGSTAPPKEAV